MKKQFYQYITPILILKIFLLLLLIGFQSIWVAYQPSTSLMTTIGFQRGREQRLVKDVLILAYRPLSEHPQAISEIQTILPVWQQVQNGLQFGDDSLHLPHHVPEDVQTILIQCNQDYVPMLSALKVIVAHIEKPVDTVQLQILLDHENGYYLSISQVISLWQQHIDTTFFQIFLWELNIAILLIGIILGTYFIIIRKVLLLLKIQDTT